ncbi:MAG: ABC transporter ATP-binding protein [Thermoanaerobaculia bacterium]
MLIEVEKLVKDYGDQRALAGIDLAIEAGGTVGLLGPNGAGKTTLVEILEGLREPTSGSARVFGLDPRKDSRALRLRIGVQLQATALPQELRVSEVLRLYAAFYPKTLTARAVLEQVELAGKERALVRTLSGGERQRVSLALALLHDPELLILDEPTAALDPVARRGVHAIVERLAAAGKTVVLTTHYIEEAEKLCKRVILLRRGTIVADGSPFDLIGHSAGLSTMWIEVDGPFDPARLLGAGAVDQGREGRHLRFTVSDPGAIVVALGDTLRAGGGKLIDLRLRRPTLEDVYLEFMGEQGASAQVETLLNEEKRA